MQQAVQLQMCLGEANVGETTNDDSYTVIFITQELGKTDEVSYLEPRLGQECVCVCICIRMCENIFSVSCKQNECQSHPFKLLLQLILISSIFS